MDTIDITAPAGERRERFFARSVGTSFDARASASDSKVTEIDLYDEVSYWGVNAKDFRNTLRGAGDITLRINSPGGNVFDGLAIYNDLVSHEGHVRVEVVGLAASIASIIAMAGDEVLIADNAFFMIHNAWTMGVGNRHDFNELSGTLSKIDDALARTYTAKTGTGIRSIKQMMDDETWLSAKEAKELGFASGSTSEPDAKAKFDLSVFAAAPQSLSLSDDDNDGADRTLRDWERKVMQDAGYSRSKVRDMMRAIKAPTVAEDDTKQDAGDVDLTAIAEAARRLAAI